jgi:amino acid adenylation domain-containing protein/non-ribosomal peptide synthase protein (TIGR01720 family)/FkbM family methyltransferase
MDTQVESPLSFAQQRLWFIEQMFPGGSVYNIPAALRLTGKLNTEALRQSLHEIVRQHAVLRSTFSAVDGKPKQMIHQHFALRLPLVDLRDLPREERDAEVSRLLTRAARVPFDLKAGPLLRVVLLWIEPCEYVLSLTIHHIVSDGWSMGILVRELAALYSSFTTGKTSPLAELRIQYTDYVRWQRKRLSGSILEDQLSYWKRQLHGAPPVLHLPADRPGTASESFRGRHETFKLSPELSESLRSLSRANGVTLFMTLLAAFQTLLARYVNQPDIVVGVPIANRTRTEMESLVGFFVNSLVMRTDTSGDPTFRQLLERVRKVALEAYSHQDVPFEKLVDELQVERSLNHTPLFQVMFALQNAPQGSLELPELKLEQIDFETGTTKFDLTLQMEEAGPFIRGSVGYQSDLFDQATIELMIDHFQQLLNSIVGDPNQRLSELSIFGEQERQQLLGAKVQEFTVSECLHEWFTRQAKRTPDAIAVTDESGQLTYAELDAATNQLATYLRRRGVGPESIVALYLPRSLRMVQAILGVLKAGGAYLPLDASSPAARIKQMLEDSGALLVLSETGAEAALESINTPVIELEKERNRIASESVDPPSSGVTPQNLAYVIYTSGSTGKPKGVLIIHENVARLFQSTEAWYHPNETDVWTLFHSYAFDFSVWELWGALLYGGRLVVVPYWTSRSSESFYHLLVANQVTILNQTPSAFRQLIEVDKAQRSNLAVRYVIFAGEALEPQSLGEWFDRHGDEQPLLVNMYGITETTVHVTYRPMKKADALSVGPGSIGIPIPDLQVYLLDRVRHLSPLTAPGEIYVGGAGLARGYSNQPELTAQRFIPDMFGPHPGARLYKSGDLARCSADGEMRYLGRGDEQVKIRGFRIEPGEIKLALEQHPGVQEAVVMVATEGEKRLVAYLVPDPQQAPALHRLLRFKREGLIDGHLLYQLPNGLTIVHLNNAETVMAYNEIFGNENYLRHGVTLEEGSCVFDVGANIGLFSLFVGQRCERHTIYAFEPIPQVFELLRLNAYLHGLNVKLFECGLSSEGKGEVFTFYPHCSLISGCSANLAEEREAVKTFLMNSRSVGEGAELLDELLTERLKADTVVCQLRTISEVIRKHGVEQIDLLKIDVEKSELNVLLGILDDDWSKIRQLVVEVHDTNGRLEHIVSLLKLRGFELTIEQMPPLKETGIYNVYAVRPRAGNGAGTPSEKDYAKKQTWGSEAALVADVRHFLKGRVPDYMIPPAFVLVERIPLTPNGKLDREALPVPSQPIEPGYFAPRTAVEQSLAKIWAGVLGNDSVGVMDNFFELGGDSILSIQVVARAKNAGLHFTPKHLFQYQSIAELAKVVGSAPAVAAEPEILAGAASLTPVQAWFFEHFTVDSHHFNQAVLLKVRPGSDPSVVENAVRELVNHHDALRLRFVRDAAGWSQFYASTGDVPFARISLAGLEPVAQAAAIEREAAALQARLNLSDGPLLQMTFFDLGKNCPSRLLLIIHHLAVDTVSWRILLEDLETACQQLIRDEPIALHPKTTSYMRWSERLRKFVAAGGLAAEVDYWLAERWRQVTPIPRDHSGGENTVASARRVLVSLTAEETRRLLQDVPKVLHASVQELLLAAVTRALTRWSGAQSIVLDMEGHGREDLFEDIDLSRTVGWFTTIYPVLLNAPSSDDVVQILRTVKEDLRDVPQKGIGYGLLRYLGTEDAIASRLKNFPQPEVSFNYLGQFDQLLAGSALFEWARESTGSPHSPAGKRSHVLDISGYVVSECLHIAWSYSEQLHAPQTVEALVDDFMISLRSLIVEGHAPGTRTYLPSDFPLAKISQPELDRIISNGTVEDIYPLSPMQHGILFHSLYAQESAVYFQQFRCTLRGTLELRAFERAWQQLLARHASLRSTFEWEGLDEPLQVVRRDVRLPLVVHDWRGLSPALQRGKVEDFLERDRERPFNLSRAPLMRLVLVRIDDDISEFIWSYHHLLVDGWSFALALKEIFLLYEADLQSKQSPLGRSGSYQDYIAWLRQQDEAAAEKFWRRTLKGFNASLSLGGRSEPDDTSAFNWAFHEQEIRLPEDLTTELQRLARRGEVTLNTLLQGAWALLLNRHTGKEDVIFGSVVSGRPPELPNVESTIGLFINTLPVRVEVAPDVPLLPWLKQLQAQQAEAREYEYSSLVRIQNWSDVLPGQPLFESILIFENYPLDSSLRLDRVNLTILEYRSHEKSNYPLALIVAPGAHMLLQIKYDAQRFSAASIERMLSHLRALLEDMTNHSDKDLKSLSMLDAQDSRQLICAFNDELN